MVHVLVLKIEKKYTFSNIYLTNSKQILFFEEYASLHLVWSHTAIFSARNLKKNRKIIRQLGPLTDSIIIEVAHQFPCLRLSRKTG